MHVPASRGSGTALTLSQHLFHCEGKRNTGTSLAPEMDSALASKLSAVGLIIQPGGTEDSVPASIRAQVNIFVCLTRHPSPY